MKILFTPMPLIECQKLHWFYRMGLFELSDEPDLTFRWEYPNVRFPRLPNAINGNCIDVSKTNIDRIFKQVYGYSTEAESGPAIEKNNTMNGLKDVRLVDLKEKRDGYFYQKPLVEGEYIETRLVIMNGYEVYRILKYKTGIPGKVTKYQIVDSENNYKVSKFCKLIGLDYGEIDMIGEVIIDINPTPGDAAFVYMPLDIAYKYQQDYANLFKIHYA